MTRTPIQNVSETARWVALFRAEESARSDALFEDALARKLVGDLSSEIASQMGRTNLLRWSIVIRTTIIDEMIQSVLAGGVDTVLNLGAGLDTRPYRIDLPPELRWIEVDFSHVIDYKNKVLKDERPRCLLERVAIDLNERHAREHLLEQINIKSRKVLVITEGVIPYLNPNQAGDLADTLAMQSHFNYWIQDFYSAEAIKNAGRSHRHRLGNAPFSFVVPDWLTFFEDRGWKKSRAQSMLDQAKKIGRPMRGPLWFWLLMKLPSSKARMRKAMGCVLLERY